MTDTATVCRDDRAHMPVSAIPHKTHRQPRKERHLLPKLNAANPWLQHTQHALQRGPLSRLRAAAVPARRPHVPRHRGCVRSMHSVRGAADGHCGRAASPTSRMQLLCCVRSRRGLFSPGPCLPCSTRMHARTHACMHG